LWLPLGLRRCGLNCEFQLEEVRRCGLHFAHPGLRRAGRGHVLWRDLNAFAALLVQIDAHLVRLLVGRCLNILLLLSALFLLRFQRGRNDCAIGPGGDVLRLRFQHSVVGIDCLLKGVVLGLRIGERKLAFDRVDLREGFRRLQKS
jgi:hypothetical protein